MYLTGRLAWAYVTGVGQTISIESSRHWPRGLRARHRVGRTTLSIRFELQAALHTPFIVSKDPSPGISWCIDTSVNACCTSRYRVPGMIGYLISSGTECATDKVIEMTLSPANPEAGRAVFMSFHG